MKHNFPYLKDSVFLKNFDKIKLKQQFIKLIVLTFDQQPIQQIQGKATGGNLSLDGSSSMRRTGNISLVADPYQNDLTDTKHLLSINKKVELLVGFTNTTDEYKEFPILWFPQGVYVIVTPNITYNSSGINISLTLHDKMALLNGQCGGVLPASVVFHEMQDVDVNGDRIIIEPTIYQIIQELVNHFGGQQLGKIIISDVDNRIKKVMKWTGSIPIYLYQEFDNENNNIYYRYSTNYNELTKNKTQEEIEKNLTSFNYGQDVGYILTDFTYPGELIGNAGDTVVTILDQIKDTLGNYEYFYDIEGNFRFQQIKNYLNTSYSTFKINQINADNYLVDYAGGKSVYTFQGADIIQSYTNAPQYQQIKNDFMIWGKRISIDGQEIPIRYHLAIDEKPQTGNVYTDIFFYTDPENGIMKPAAKAPIKFLTKDDFPVPGLFDQYYYADKTKTIYKWDPVKNEYEETDYKLTSVESTDYRTQLYLSGVVSEPLGLTSNYYFTELKNEWPKLYDISNKEFYGDTIAEPSDIDFFLDFIDTPSSISEFSVNNIGRRTTTLVDDSINCIFEPDNPDIVIINTDNEDVAQLRQQCIHMKQEFVQMDPDTYSMLANGGVLRSAYEEMRKELYQYTSYNEQVSLTVIPIYYLEPNVRITVRNLEVGIYGDYMINSISLPLGTDGTMSLSCVKALERI